MKPPAQGQGVPSPLALITSRVAIV